MENKATVDKILQFVAQKLKGLMDEDKKFLSRIETTERDINQNKTDITSLQSEVNTLKSDSGWKNLAYSTINWKDTVGDKSPLPATAVYRKNGNMVDIRINLESKISLNAGNEYRMIIKDLPTELIPSTYSVRTVGRAGGKSVLVIIYNKSSKNAGTIEFVGNNLTAGNQLQFHTTYLAD